MILPHETFNLAHTSATCLGIFMADFCGAKACGRTRMGGSHSRNILGRSTDLSGHHQNAPYFDLGGFSLSMWAASGALTMPPIGWLLLLGLIVVIYPRKAWKDAPLFPTPRRALRQLPEHITLLGGARILDAGSGLGDGLIALRDAYPRADLNGVEMSWPLRIISAIRCSFATIRQGDIWMVDWRSYDMVYMFQRPESMPRAIEKAEVEMRRGAWLVSLEFEAIGIVPSAIIYGKDSRPIWVYQLPFQRRG